MAYKATIVLYAICIATTFILQGCSPRNTSTVHPDLRHTLVNSSFQTILSTTNLPAAIVALCAGDQGKLADPNQEWESTDIVRDPSLPTKRLIWAAVSSDIYVVQYEQGGRGHRCHVIAASLVSSNATEEARWTWPGEPFQDFTSFQTALQTCRLDQNLN